jgi:AcrR family transcriptional regulator
MRAVIECIAEVGLKRTTALEITRRAGVTWGAVQHHFGDKDGILVAVLEDSFARFATRLDDIPLEGTSLDERARLFVERAWQHLGSADYRSTFEILLASAGEVDARVSDSWQTQMFRAWDQIWKRLFSEASVSRQRHLVLQHFTISALSGFASTLMLEGGDATLRRAELDLLVRTLQRELAS